MRPCLISAQRAYFKSVWISDLLTQRHQSISKRQKANMQQHCTLLTTAWGQIPCRLAWSRQASPVGPRKAPTWTSPQRSRKHRYAGTAAGLREVIAEKSDVCACRESNRNPTYMCRISTYRAALRTTEAGAKAEAPANKRARTIERIMVLRMKKDNCS